MPSSGCHQETAECYYCREISRMGTKEGRNMTAQINDFVRYQGERYSLAGVRGEGLFDPNDHGVRPEPANTACWRGFVCGYKVSEDRLQLDSLVINLAEADLPKAQAGTLPGLVGKMPASVGGFWGTEFSDLSMPIIFTGGFLIGREFIDDLYVHMGFHPGWKYKVVHELLFKGGRLIEARDHSEDMEKIRSQMKSDSLEPGTGASEKSIPNWIEKTFSRDY